MLKKNRRIEDRDFFKDDDLLNDDPIDDSFNDFNSSPGDFAPAMEKHGDLLKELTNFEPYIRDKVNGWLGLVWSQEKETFIVNSAVEPIMNIKCANWCIDFLKTYARDNNIITNLSQDEFYNIYFDIVDVLWLNLPLRSDEFGIKCNGDIMKICVEMEHSAILVLLGAGDGKYNKLLTETVNRTENISTSPLNQQKPKNKGLLTSIKNIFS